MPTHYTVTTLRIPGFPAGSTLSPECLIFFDPTMQEIYKAWAQQVLEAPNSKEGRPTLGDDPAVMIWEIANDDSLFAYNFRPRELIPADVIRPLEEEFTAWAVSKYRSIDGAKAAWNAILKPVKGDGPEWLALMKGWHLTKDGEKEVNAQRAADQRWFMAERMHEFYSDMETFIEGFTNSPDTVGGNTYRNPPEFNSPWDPWDRYGDTACAVVDRHAYWGGEAENPNAAPYAISKKDKWKDKLGQENPVAGPDGNGMNIREVQYEGHPHMVSEFSFPMINKQRTDGVFLGAVYGATQGTDAICSFRVDSPAWDRTLGKWPVMTAAGIGQFPALALAYRRGYIPEADWVFKQRIKKETGTPVDIPDAWSYYVGRVIREFTDKEPGKDEVDLSPFLDKKQKRVRTKPKPGNLRSEVRLDGKKGKGVSWVDAPLCQGATGRLKRVPANALEDVVVDAGPDYGCVVVVSLQDDAPISSADRLLVQVMSEETNYGWKQGGWGPTKTLDEIGTGPLNVRNISGEVTILRWDTDDLEVKALDPNGYEMTSVVVDVDRGDFSLTINLEENVLYCLVSKKPPETTE